MRAFVRNAEINPNIVRRTFLEDKGKCGKGPSSSGGHEDGRKLHAGTIEAGDPRELVVKWSLFLATAERGVYFATYRRSFVGPEPALENDGGHLAA